MTVYFLRHANAGHPLATPKLDDKRPLDEKGAEQARVVGHLLAAMGEQVDTIVSSPLKRATQTASLVANELGHEGKIEISKALLPDAKYEAFRSLLDDLSAKDAIMVVGHNSGLSEYLSLLVTGGASSDAIDLKKGAVAKLEVGSRGCILRWTFTPALAAAGMRTFDLVGASGADHTQAIPAAHG